MTGWLRRNGFPDIGKQAVDRLMRGEGYARRGSRRADPDHEPFRSGPLRRLADVETLTMNYVHWYNEEASAQPAGLRHPDRA